MFAEDFVDGKDADKPGVVGPFVTLPKLSVERVSAS